MKFVAMIVGLLFTVAFAVVLNPGATGISFAALAPAKAVERAAQPAGTDLAEAAELEAAEIAKDALDISGATGAWRSWMARHKISAGSMALGINGQILSAESAGGRSADTPYPVASLSKAVTAMCLNDIFADSQYNWSTTLGELTPVLATLNMPAHQGVRDIELRQFANHTSGFAKNFDGDETAGEGRNLYTQQHFAREALTNPDRKRHEGKFRYSNVNYAVLGQIITAISGEPYKDVCTARVMAPAGITDAVIGGRMWATGGFGGWSASAESYARFIMHWYAPDRPWVRTPDAYPFDAKNGAGMGAFYKIDGPQFVINHNGLWRSKKAERQHGALFVTSETGATFVANWQGSLKNDAYADLRNALVPYLR